MTAPDAKADPFTYNLAMTNGNTVQFTLQNNSAPSAFQSGVVANFCDVTGTFDGQTILFSCIGFNTPNAPFLQNEIAVGIGSPQAPYTMFFGSGNTPVFSGNANSVQLFAMPNGDTCSGFSYTPWQNYLNYEASTHVPEPGSLALLSLGALALLGFRRKLLARLLPLTLIEGHSHGVPFLFLPDFLQ